MQGVFDCVRVGAGRGAFRRPGGSQKWWGPKVGWVVGAKGAGERNQKPTIKEILERGSLAVRVPPGGFKLLVLAAAGVAA